MFNDSETEFEVERNFDPEEFPALKIAILAQNCVDPNNFFLRPGRTLHEKYRSFVKEYGKVKEKWAWSGRHDGKSFHTFCPGSKVLQYLHLMCEAHDLLAKILTKSICGGWRTDSESGGSTTSGDGEDSGGKRKRGVARESPETAILSVISQLSSSLVSSSSSTSPSSPSPLSSPTQKKRKVEEDTLTCRSKVEEKRSKTDARFFFLFFFSSGDRSQLRLAGQTVALFGVVEMMMFIYGHWFDQPIGSSQFGGLCLVWLGLWCWVL